MKAQLLNLSVRLRLRSLYLQSTLRLESETRICFQEGWVSQFGTVPLWNAGFDAPISSFHCQNRMHTPLRLEREV